MTFLPAPPNTGVRFRRVDLDGKPEIEARDVKTLPDFESAGACWIDYEELRRVRLRGSEPLEWFKYVVEGGTIFPLSIFGEEGEPPEVQPQPQHHHASSKGHHHHHHTTTS